MPFVLASRSPRRRDLLHRLGLQPEVRPSDVDEHIDADASPATVVQDLAMQKAADISAANPAALVLGADTVVVLDGAILGKPEDADQARSMLASLSGRTHDVFTGIALVHAESVRRVTAVARTEVRFGSLSSEEIDWYVAGGSPMDKAGAYGIQDDAGALFVDSIRGDYYNVVGLPLRTMYHTLQTHFSDLVGR